MAFTVSNLGLQSSSGTASSIAVASASAAIGDMVVVCVAASNSGTSGVAVTTTCADSAGNTYTQRSQVNYTPGGVADDGITLTVFTSLISSTLTAGSITVSFSPSSAQASAMNVVRYRPASGETALFVAAGAGATGNSAAPSITASSVANLDLIIGAIAEEAGTTITQDSDATDGSWSTKYETTIGSGNTAAHILSQSKAVTATGAQSFDVTTSAAHDFAANYIVIRSAKTVAAAASSYAVTGQAANPKRSSKVVASVGSYLTDVEGVILGAGGNIIGTNPFAMTNGSAVVRVTHTSHGLSSGNLAFFSGASSAGGITIAGVYPVTVITANTYDITHSSAATSTTTGGGTLVRAGYSLQNQFVRLRRSGDGHPLYEQIIIWSDFDLIKTTDPDQLERLEYKGLGTVPGSGTSYHRFRVHFRDLKTTVVTLGSNPIATTSGSAVVRVTHTAHGRRTGEFVRFSGASSVGGFQVNGSSKYEYQITYVSDNTYDITQRNSIVMGANPFAMTNTSAVVRVTHTSHGCSTGTSVFFSDVDSAGGIKIAGTYVMTVIDANTYDITHSAAATSTTTGGGTSITASYDTRATSTATGGGSSVVATYNEFQIALDTSFSFARAESLALMVAPRLGKLPRFYRQNLNVVYVPAGAVPFSAGEGNFTLSEDRIAIRVAYNDLEESCLHEGTHAVLDEYYQGKGLALTDHPGWEAARVADVKFLDDYSTTNTNEDIAQAAVMSLAMLTHPERISAYDRALINAQIPNRIAFLRDYVWVYPFTACAPVSVASVVSKLPARFVDSLVNNTSLASHCRDMANMKVEAFYSRAEFVAGGIPDLYRFKCDVCGREHPRTCIGNEPRAFWDVR